MVYDSRLSARLVLILSALLLILGISSSSFASISNLPAQIQRVAVIVPVYREFYNQNLGSVLESLDSQDLSGLAFQHLDVYFIINNTDTAQEDVRKENQETVHFLKDIEHRRIPTIPNQFKKLKKIAQRPLADKLNIHVVDLTSPGRLTRNMGEVRDLGVQAALQSIPRGLEDNSLVMHLDADTVFATNLFQKIVRAFEREPLKFALLSLSYTDQEDSDPRVYKRKITSDYLIAAHDFRLVQDGDMPYGGGPRIVSTAAALREVGGVPHVPFGEDSALIKNFKSKFSEKGRFLDIPVFAKYRAREDGFDAAIYRENLDRSVEFSEYETSASHMLEEVFIYLRKDPVTYRIYQEALEIEENRYLVGVRALKRQTNALIRKIQNGAPIDVDDDQSGSLTSNVWFGDLLQLILSKRGAGPTQVFKELQNRFPYYFSDPPLQASQAIFKLNAAKRALMHKALLIRATSRIDYLLSVYEDFPQTVDGALRRRVAEFFRRWQNLKVGDDKNLNWSLENSAELQEFGALVRSSTDRNFPRDVADRVRRAAAEYSDHILHHPEADSATQAILDRTFGKNLPVIILNNRVRWQKVRTQIQDCWQLLLAN